MRKKFVIICQARTGSNYLCFYLSSLPGFCCHLEVFHQDAIYWKGSPQKKEIGVEALSLRDAQPIEFIRDLYANSGRQLTGFKLFVNHNPQALEFVLANPEIQVVVLHRENTLAQYSSLLIAQQKQAWHSLTEEKTGQQEAISIAWNENAFAAYQQQVQREWGVVMQLLSRSKKPYFAMEYKELHNSARITELLMFLGIPQAVAAQIQHLPKVPLKKQNTSQILSRFEQPELVSAYLQKISKPQWAIE